jgi:hypothetical protein
MRPVAILYACWCALVIGGLIWAGIHGYSPFADGARAPGAQAAYGPQHK